MSDIKKYITVRLTVDDALDAGVAMALAEYISKDRFPFEKCNRIAMIFLDAVSKEVHPQ